MTTHASTTESLGTAPPGTQAANETASAGESSPPSPWPYPFADRHGGRFTGVQWLAILAGMLALFAASIVGAIWTDNYKTGPNFDHRHYMYKWVETGWLGTPRQWAPGYSVYMAGKWQATEALGLSYEAGKYLFDVWLVLGAGVLTVLLAAALTRNRWLALSAGFGYLLVPVVAFAAAEDLAVVLFQPLFLGALLLFVRALQALPRWRIGHFFWAGALLGLATLVRTNTLLLPLALAALVIWLALRTRPAEVPRRLVVGQAMIASALLVLMTLALALPWEVYRSMHPHGPPDSPLARTHFDGVVRHPGNAVADALRENYREPERSISGIVAFHWHWLHENPWSLIELHALRLARTWWKTDSGVWDGFAAMAHAPWLLFGVVGVWRWRRAVRSGGASRDPASVFALAVILYLWFVAVAAAGFVRYMIPVFGLVSLFAAVGLAWSWRAWIDARHRMRPPNKEAPAIGEDDNVKPPPNVAPTSGTP